MKKELEDKLLKHAEEVVSTGGLASSPLLQSAILGGLGYFATDYLYDKIANNPWQEKYIQSIQDPEERELVRRKFEMERENKKKWWRRGIGATMFALPLLNNYKTIGKGWNKGQSLWGGPTIVDRGISGISGSLAGAIGGDKAVGNIERMAAAKHNMLGTSAFPNISMGKQSSEKSYIYDNLEKEASYSNAMEGLDFKMPYVRPLYTNGIQDIPVMSSMKLISSPNNMEALGAPVVGGINKALDHASGGLGAGLISTNDLVKGLTRAGFGYMGGHILGQTLGTIFAQPPEVKKNLNMISGIAGAILNTGVIQ